MLDAKKAQVLASVQEQQGDSLMSFEPIFDAENEELQFLKSDLERTQFTYDLLDAELRSWFERDTLVLRAHYSTWIEGNTLREEEVDDLVDPADKETSTVDEREVVNYIEALNWIDEFSQDGNRPIDERVIRHLHKLILGGIDPALTPGGYRKGQNYVRDPATRKRRFTPPDAGDVPALMRELSLWLRQERAQRKDSILIAGIAHLELLAIHPFWDGNGRVARALSTLIMQHGKRGFENLIVLDRYFGLRLKEYYDQTVAATGEKYERRRDITSWLIYFMEAVLVEARWVHDLAVDANILRQRLRETLKARGLKTRQADGVVYCMIRGRIRPKDYQRINGVSPFVASRDLMELEDNEMLRGQGQTRRRVYILHRNIEDQLQEQREERAQEEPLQLGLL